MFKLLSEYKKKNKTEKIEQNYDILKRYHLILPTILNLPINIINCETQVNSSMIAAIIRNHGHQDIMDCWIAGTAASVNGVLLTEDNDLIKVLKFIPETSNMKILNWDELEKVIEKPKKNKKRT